MMLVEAQLVDARERLHRIVGAADAAVENMEMRRRFARQVRAQARRRLLAPI